MFNKFRKRVIIPAVCFSILASAPANVFASRFGDADIHWAKSAIERWADYEVVQGFDGMFRPDDTISRAEMAVMINRIMNYQERAENTFKDLPETWYTDAVLKLVKQGVMVGDNGLIRPEEPVTREESLVMIARALGIKDDGVRSISFSDDAKISEWARYAVEAMTEKGFLNGYEDGTFRPQDDMTRACSVTVVNNSIKGFYNKPGTYQADEALNGYVVVNSPDVVLEGMTINGDLIVTPGVQDGTVTLKGTTVSGEQIIMGGGSVEEEPGTNPTPTPTATPTATPKPTSTPGGGGGGGITQNAPKTDIIVNSSYADKTGTIISNNKRYTFGENAFGTLAEAAAQAQTLQKKASITLLSDLTLDSTVELQASDLTLDGRGFTLTYSQGVKDGIQIVQADRVLIKDLNVQMQDETEKWNGSYGIQAYESTVTLNDVKATGADAGILVNGAEVTLEGVVDVSGNEFGGIEVAKGVDATTMPKLKGTAANLKNDTEQSGKPTIWIDKVSELTSAVVEVSGLNEKAAEKDQMHYFLGEIPYETTAEAASQAELEAALADSRIETIYLTSDFTVDKTLKIVRAVEIIGQNGVKTITFENKNGIQLENAGTVKLENVKVAVTGDEEGWQGLYALQAYGTSVVTLKDVAATGADGGILVNGAEVTLEGVVDVSGNEFGGIEVAKGVDATTMPKLKGTAANLKNDTEQSSGKPTIWIDKVSELTAAVVEVSGLNEKEVERDQLYFYLGEVPVDSDDSSL